MTFSLTYKYLAGKSFACQMSSLFLAGLLLCFHASAAFSASSNFTLCQTLTSEEFPLDGCPANTIYVPANGSIQSTIESL